jgi:hypothetical protein
MKSGFRITKKKGRIQRYQCSQGHIFIGEHLPEDLLKGLKHTSEPFPADSEEALQK